MNSLTLAYPTDENDKDIYACVFGPLTGCQEYWVGGNNPKAL